MQRNKGLKYCFVEASWEVLSRSFAAHVISLAFSEPFLVRLMVAGFRYRSKRKTFTFHKLLSDKCDDKDL